MKEYNHLTFIGDMSTNKKSIRLIDKTGVTTYILTNPNYKIHRDKDELHLKQSAVSILIRMKFDSPSYAIIAHDRLRDALKILAANTSETDKYIKLSEVLNNGNSTDGENIIISIGDNLIFAGIQTGQPLSNLGIDANGNVILGNNNSTIFGTYIDDQTFNDLNGNPVNLEEGQLYYDSSNNTWYQFNGTKLEEFGAIPQIDVYIYKGEYIDDQTFEENGNQVNLEEDRLYHDIVNDKWYYYDGTKLRLLIEDQIYYNTVPTSITVGGINAGTNLDGKTYSEIFDDMFYPELWPTLVAPTSTFTMSVSGAKEIGSVISSITFESTFNQGSINPQYQSTSDKRSGLPNKYEYTGYGLIDQNKNALNDIQTINNYEVILGDNTWTSQIHYDIGIQPKGSKGTDYNLPLPAGNIIKTVKFEGAYPIYATTVNITTATKQTLVSMNSSNVELVLVTESGTDKQFFDIPDDWLLNNPLNKIEYWNEVTNSYINIDKIGDYNTSAITHAINGNVINYTRYTYKETQRGEIKIKLMF